MTNVNEEVAGAVLKTMEQNGDKLETITLRVNIEQEMFKKMKSVISLFSDEVGVDIKNPELVSFFLKKGFECLVSSGEFDKRLKSVLEG